MERASQMEKPQGYEKWKVAQERKARSARKRRAAEREAKDTIFQRLVRRQKRHRGETGIPQIVTHATAERWKREPHTCPACSGRGIYIVFDKKANGLRKNPCDRCEGRGEVYGRNPGNAVQVIG